MSVQVPLYRALSKLGYTSRTGALALIAAGEIRVNKTLCSDPDYLVSTDTDLLFHHDQLITQKELCVILLYKPKSIITSRKDEQDRPTVYSLLPPELQSLHCVGRLDYATSGLLLLTNNTLLSSWLTDPVNGVPRIYVVTVRGLVTPEKTRRMEEGIIEGGQELRSDSIIVRKSSRRESHLVMTLREGKNREVRRLCSSVGHEVTKLKRVAYGPLDLGTMSPGEHRHISHKELCAAFPDLQTANILYK